MQPDAGISAVAHAIQLAVAPVFLLSGVGALLAVLTSLTALLVCAVIATLFLGAFARFDVSVPVALLFVAAMIALFVGLLAFLREIFLATANLRIGPS
ncbi:MAG: hypothetical protein DMD61_07515 [Gemmatimonadetes bacterium]|nr:MAG: hypothetical protein DMD61_07515 [Gemmatimonadota bacterium]